MIIEKITEGYVIQRFDIDQNKFISQEFVAQHSFLDAITKPSIEKIMEMQYLPFEMKQPDEMERTK